MKLKFRNFFLCVCLISFSTALFSCDKSSKTISSLDNLSDLSIILTSNKETLTALDEWIYNDNITELDGIVVDDFVNYKIKYKSGKYKVTGLVSAPSDYMETEYPVLIYNRGGYKENGRNTIDQIQLMAGYGFIVLATQYRGVDGGTGTDEFAGGDLEDTIKLIDVAEMFTFTNNRIYMFGWSRGSVNTYRALQADDNKRIRAAVAGGGLSDIKKSYDERDDRNRTMLVNMIGGTPEELPDEYDMRSAMKWADEIDTPLLIVHGENDDVISKNQSLDFYNELDSLGKDVEVKTYVGGHDGSPEITDYIFQWLLSK